MGALPEDNRGGGAELHAALWQHWRFTNELKSLEAAVKAKPDDPALRFLLGFQYGYLNYPKQAVDELGQAVELEGRDPAARKLHDVFAAKIGAPLVGPVPHSAEGPKAAEPGSQNFQPGPAAAKDRRLTTGFALLDCKSERAWTRVRARSLRCSDRGTVTAAIVTKSGDLDSPPSGGRYTW